jgi:hypothetical protein
MGMKNTDSGTSISGVTVSEWEASDISGVCADTAVVDEWDQDNLKWWLTAYGHSAHPAFENQIVENLLEAAGSSDIQLRLMAVHHRLMPYARVVMMQDDPDPAVQEAVKMIMEHEEA